MRIMTIIVETKNIVLIGVMMAVSINVINAHIAKRIRIGNMNMVFVLMAYINMKCTSN